MLDRVLTGLLWFSALGCGLLGGLYFAFSAFIMRALGRIDRTSGIAAMNKINVEIVRSAFMPLFFGTTLSSAALVVVAVLHWNAPASMAMFVGGAVYVVGMFIVTMVRNVPLNNELAAADASSTSAEPVWARYRREWTRWNDLRTIACIVATLLYVFAIDASY